MAVYDEERHPARLQTQTGWRRLGWRVQEGAPYDDSLKTRYRKRGYPLYDYVYTTPIPGPAALERRVEFMLAYCSAVVMRHAEVWVFEHALMGLITDEQIQDEAVQPHDAKFQTVFFADQLPTIPVPALTDRMRFAFELGALKALGRDYSAYRYNEF